MIAIMAVLSVLNSLALSCVCYKAKLIGEETKLACQAHYFGISLCALQELGDVLVYFAPTQRDALSNISARFGIIIDFTLLVSVFALPCHSLY